MTTSNAVPVLAVSLFLMLGLGVEQSPGQKPTIRVEVEMVSLPVVVTDRSGRRITDLRQEDFQVFEDGQPQEIAGFGATDEPLKIALLLDTSGSTEKRLARIQNSAIRFVNGLHPDDEVAVLSFADEVRLQEDFSMDRDRNAYGIKKTRKGGDTALYEAVWLALEEVLRPVRERKALVIFSDGVDTVSRKASASETLDLAEETRATIYSVYFNTEGDRGSRRTGPAIGTGIPEIVLDPFPSPFPSPGPSTRPSTGGSSSDQYRAGREYLARLAEYSGGLVLDGMDDLDHAFGEVAKELASQYSIGYYSTNPRRDGKFRKVSVKVGRPGLVARTKKGYTAARDRK